MVKYGKPNEQRVTETSHPSTSTNDIMILRIMNHTALFKIISMMN